MITYPPDRLKTDLKIVRWIFRSQNKLFEESTIPPCRSRADLQYGRISLAKKLKIPINKVAIELNQTIVNKKSLGKIKITKNDKIEIVHFIGGG